MSEVRRQVDSFLASTILLGQKNCYIEEYKVVLDSLVNYCKKNNIDTLKAFGNPEFGLFLKDCGINTRHKAESYIKKILVLFRYLKRVGEVSHLIVEVSVVHKTPKNRRMYHDSATLKVIRSKIASEFDLCIFDLIMSTGVSLGEVHRIRREDVNWNTGATIIRDTSWKASRTIYILPKLLERLSNLSKINVEFVFSIYSKYGRCYKQMQLGHINNCLRLISNEIGVTVNCTTLKNSFCYEFYRTTGDLIALQKILGYKNFEFAKRRVTPLYYKIEHTSKEIFEYKNKGVKYVSTEDF